MATLGSALDARSNSPPAGPNFCSASNRHPLRNDARAPVSRAISGASVSMVAGRGSSVTRKQARSRSRKSSGCARNAGATASRANSDRVLDLIVTQYGTPCRQVTEGVSRPPMPYRIANLKSAISNLQLQSTPPFPLPRRVAILHADPTIALVVSNRLNAMTSRNALALGLTAVSIGLLIPGLTQPVLTIVASINMLGVTQELFRQTQSVLEAVRTLHENDNDFVAGLILFFSITVPFLKALALVIILLLRDQASRYRLYLMVRSLSKWAMADVFAVGVFIAMLAARGTDNLDGIPGPGFYFFAAYCLVSNLAFQLLLIPPPQPQIIAGTSTA